MEKGIVARKSPFPVDLEKGRTYAWCACGRSGKQPFCDGSHKGTGHAPVVFKAEESKQVWLCGCKQTDTRPYCDGTHNSL
jgi:CDGSH-type Zn-finger protein